MRIAHAEFARRLLPGTAWGVDTGGAAGPPQPVAAIGAAWPGERGKSGSVVESRLSDEILRATMSGLEEMARGLLKGCSARDIQAEEVAQVVIVRIHEKNFAADAAGREGPHGGALRLYVRHVISEMLDQRKRRREVACADVDEIEAPGVPTEDEPVPAQALAGDSPMLACLTAKQERAARLVSEGHSFAVVAEKESVSTRAIERRCQAAGLRLALFHERGAEAPLADPALPAPRQMRALRGGLWRYAPLARRFGLKEAAARQAVSRARRRES